METKICCVCKVEKSLDEFHNSSYTKSGKIGACKYCISERKKQESYKVKRRIARRNKRWSDSEYREKLNKRLREFVIESKEKYLVNKAKQRAKKLGLEFNIDYTDIIIPEYCPILGIKFIHGKPKDYQYSPSLDRIDSSKGYIKGNVAVISTLANTMKNKATREELEAFSKNILNYIDQNNDIV